jgi:DNA-binding CsgD family transcriptional regulator
MDQPVGTPTHLAAAVIACERTRESDAAAELRWLLSTASSPEYLPFIAYAQGLTAILQRDIAAGIEAVQETLDKMGHWTPPPFGQNAADGCLAALLAAGGRHEEAAALAAGLSSVGSHVMCAPMTKSFVHLLGGRPRDALAGLQPCLSRDRRHAPRTLLTAHLVAAVASLELDDMIGAPRHFGRALAIARGRGIRRPFRAFPPATISELITCTRSASPHDSGVLQMCEELSSPLPRHPGRGATTKSRLSERERVILSHLGTDLSIAQLAAVLYVSPNTLKSQIKSIYRKLGVNSRAAAVAAAEVSRPRPTTAQFPSSSTIRPTMSTAEK